MENKSETLPVGFEGKVLCGVLWIRASEILRREHLFGQRWQLGVTDLTLLVPTLRVGMQTGRTASPTAAAIPEFVNSILPGSDGILSGRL